jgi:hypothetical protein
VADKNQTETKIEKTKIKKQLGPLDELGIKRRSGR